MSRGSFKIVPCGTPGVEAVAARTALSFERHTHDQFGIGVIEAGAQRWHSGRGQVEAGAGAAIALNPGEVHDGEPAGFADRTWFMMYFSPVLFLHAAREAFPHKRGQFEIPFPVIADARVTGLLRRLFVAETRQGFEMRREELLLALAARIGEVRSSVHGEPPASVALAKARVDDDPAAPLTLSDLATLAGVSRFQLIRAFVRATGLTPHAYLIQSRIDLVRRLIRGGARLAEAATSAGFADQSHMTRAFVSRYGIAPGEYAKAIA